MSPGRGLITVYAALTAASFFGFPIAALLPVMLGVASRPVSVVYRGAVLVASLAYVGAASRARRPVLPTPICWALGLLAIMLIARFMWDSLGAALPLDIDWDFLWTQVLIFNLGPVLPFLSVPSRDALAAAHNWCIWIGLLSVLAIGIGATLSFHHAQHGGRFATDVINPISVGVTGVSLFVVCLSAQGTGTVAFQNWQSATVRAVGGILGVVYCVLSASKGPLLSLVVVASVMFSYRFVRLHPRRQLLELAGVLLIICLLVVVGLVLSQHGLLTIYDRLSEAGSSRDQSTAWRVRAWTGALAQYNGSPLWGSGAVELTTRNYPHNFLLETMIAAGVGGLMVLLFLLALGSVAAHRILRDSPEYSWIVLLFLESVIVSLVSGSIYLVATLWIPLLMVFSAYQSRELAGDCLYPRQV